MENNSSPHHNPEKDALEKIKIGDIHMKPKYYFLFKGTMLILGIILICCIAMYVASLMIFFLNSQDVITLSHFGFRGLHLLLISLPWFLILLLIILVILIELFIKRFALVYQRPLFYSLVIIIFLVVTGATLIERASLHRKVFAMTEHQHIPVVGPFYKKVNRAKPHPTQKGVIIDKKPTLFVVQTPQNEKIIVFITSSTTYIPHQESFTVQDTIIVMGKWTQEGIKAWAIKKIPTYQP